MSPTKILVVITTSIGVFLWHHSICMHSNVFLTTCSSQDDTEPQQLTFFDYVCCCKSCAHFWNRETYISCPQLCSTSYITLALGNISDWLSCDDSLFFHLYSNQQLHYSLKIHQHKYMESTKTSLTSSLHHFNTWLLSSQGPSQSKKQ